MNGSIADSPQRTVQQSSDVESSPKSAQLQSTQVNVTKLVLAYIYVF